MPSMPVGAAVRLLPALLFLALPADRADAGAAAPADEVPTQYGYPVAADTIDTDDFLGVLHVENAPWVFNYRLGNWIYLPDPQSDIRDRHGVWLYALNLEVSGDAPANGGGAPTRYGFPVSDGIIATGDFLRDLNVDAAPWVYSYRMQNWMYLDDPASDLRHAHGAWGFLLNAPLRVRSVAVSEVDYNSVRISWETNGTATALVEYGLSEEDLDQSTSMSAESDTVHSVELGRLRRESTYYYRIRAEDSRGGEAVSEIRSFETGEPPPMVASWYDAWESWDEPTMIEWYQENTGPGGIGIEEADMWNPTSSGLTIDDDWIEANEGDHVYREDGRWVVEAVQAGWFTVAAEDVTLRGCLALLPANAPYAIRRAGTQSGSGPTIVVEYCQVRAAPGSDAIVRLVEASNLVVRNTEVGPGAGGTGLRLWNNVVAEYNYVHSLSGHHSGIGIRGSHAVVRRNYSETGSSASLYIYSHDSGAPSSGLTDILVEENYLNSPSAWYAMSTGGDDTTKSLRATYIHVINNRWGEQCYWPGDQGDVGGSHHFWLGRIPDWQYEDDRGNIWGGNHWISTGNWIRPQTGKFAYDHPDDEYRDPFIYGTGRPR